MSQVYSTEPAPSGRVTLDTTHGPIDMQLWCKECPATTKFFLQLALDGYYDNAKVHRIVPNLFLQIGLSNFKVTAEEFRERGHLEMHSRIKFNHRGQVAMAWDFSSKEEQSGLEPQFFITLDEAPYLDKKHVVFGTIATGPTVFNALRMGRVEVSEEGQPVDWENAPRIKSIKIHQYELDKQLVPSPTVPWKTLQQQSAPTKKKKKRKGKRDVNVLSFGDEELDMGSGGSGGMQSSHDVGKDPDTRRSKPDNEDRNKKNGEEETVIVKKKARVKEKKNDVDNSDRPSKGPSQPAVVIEDEETPGRVVYRQRNAVEEVKPQQGSLENSPKDQDMKDAKRQAQKSTTKAPSAVDAMRSKYKSHSQSKKDREEDTMAKLLAFQSKVRVKQPKKTKVKNADNDLAARMARRIESTNEEELAKGPTYRGQVLNDDVNDETDAAWLETRFHCRKHMDTDERMGGDGRDSNDYVVIENKLSRRHDRHKHHGHKKSKRHADKRR